jgi:hypothetical protein
MIKSDGGCACTSANSTPVKRLVLGHEMDALHHTAQSLPELFSLVCNRHTSVHSLHAQYLIVALLVIEHRGGKVLEDIFHGQRAICLRHLGSCL